MARAKEQGERREQLVKAALDVIRERGIGQMRIQDVAEKAGVSTGTVHYHFTDIDQLIYDVYTWVCDRFYTSRLAALANQADAREQLLGMIRTGLPDGEEDVIVLAMYEIDLYRRANPANALLGQALYDRQVALYFSVLQLGVAQGHFSLNAPALDIAQNLVALEDAYGMHIVHGNRSTSVARSHQLILDYASHVTSCPALQDPEGLA